MNKSETTGWGVCGKSLQGACWWSLIFTWNIGQLELHRIQRFSIYDLKCLKAPGTSRYRLDGNPIDPLYPIQFPQRNFFSSKIHWIQG